MRFPALTKIARFARFLRSLFAVAVTVTSLAHAATSTLFDAGGNTVTTYQNVSQDLALLSNSGKAVAYLKQVQGDAASYVPTGPQFTGLIKVLDASNNVVKTIDLRGGSYISNASYFVNDLSIVALSNGGFAAAWSENIANDFNTPVGVRYDIFDNAGNLVGNSSGSNALSATVGNGVKLAALSGGGFAAVFGTPGQSGVINTFSYNAGTYTKNTETTFLSNSTSVPGATADVGRLYTFGGGGSFTIAGLSNGGFVVTAPVYDWVSSGYTPLGVFIFGFSATGTKQNFSGTGASGQYWQRVNWNNAQTADPSRLAAFPGGFATLNFNSTRASWQATVFNNDGSLVTTTQQTVAVYNGGNKTYYAATLASVSPSVADVTTVLTSLANSTSLISNPNNPNASDVTAFLFDGTNLVAVLPSTTGGFDLASISTTTGNLVGSVASSGFTVPSSTILTNPKFILNGASYNAIFDAQQYLYSAADYGYRVQSGIYQMGLTAAADTTPPTVTSIVRRLPSTAQATNSTSATFRVTFSEAVHTPATTNFAVAPVGSGTVAGTVDTVTSVGGSALIYDVAVTITSGSGEFRLKVKD